MSVAVSFMKNFTVGNLLEIVYGFYDACVIEVVIIKFIQFLYNESTVHELIGGRRISEQLNFKREMGSGEVL